MKLIKNVDGDWSVAKQRIRQDLDTIQRNMNQVLGQINTPVPEVETPPAVFSSANTVTTFGDAGLTSVATAPTGALDGKGTITDPLAVKVDGTTVTVNGSNQLVAAGGLSSVSVAAAGALSGDGTGGNPLSVRVDGATITINGSNNLVAATPSGAILETTVTSTSVNANASPITILSNAPGGSYWEVIYATLHWHMPGSTFFNNSIQANIFYASSGGTISTVPIFNFGTYYAITSDDYWCFATKSAATYANTNTTGVNPTAGSVVLKAASNTTTGGAAGTPSVTIHVGYLLRTSP